MKFDLHIHSCYSGDSDSAPEDIVRIAKDRDLDGLAILDHNTLRGYRKAVKSSLDLIVVPGIEVSTPDGHVLAIGIQEEIGRRPSISEALDAIKDHGALAIAAHPYRFASGIGEKKILKYSWDGIEGLNGRGWTVRNRQARSLAERLDLPVTGGSDSHRLKTVGKAYTILDEVANWEDVVQKIKKGETEVEGESRTLVQTFFYVKRTLTRWALRGFERV